MSFAAPGFLAVLALVPLAAVLYVLADRRRRARSERFASPRLLPSVAPVQPGFRRHLPLVLYGVALTALAIALARPEATVAVPEERAAVVLATDISGSMQANDVAPTRMEAARLAALDFLDRAPRKLRVGTRCVQPPRALDLRAAPGSRRNPRPHRPPLPERRHGHGRGPGGRARPARPQGRPGQAAPAGGDHPALRRRLDHRPRPDRGGAARARKARIPDLHGGARHRRRDDPGAAPRRQLRDAAGAARQGHDAPDRLDQPRPHLRGLGRRRARHRLQAARLAGGHARRAARDHRGLRGRRGRACCCWAARCRCAGSGASLEAPS